MDVLQHATLPASLVSPMQLADRLLQLARDAERSGLAATAAVLLGMAQVVLEPEAEPRQEPWR